MNKILYIIPTIQRKSVYRTIQSIHDNDPNSTIVIASGGGVGDNRNTGLKMAIDEEFDWIGFIDDDDYYSPDYLKEFDDNYDIIIFKMNRNDEILPTDELIYGTVGISYFIKGSFYRYAFHRFDNKHAQDWRFLEKHLKRTDKVKITDSVYYNAPEYGGAVKYEKIH